MKLRWGGKHAVYVDGDGNVIDREHMNEKIQGVSLSDAKEIVGDHRKTVMHQWLDRQGKELGRSYGNTVMSVSVKPANAEERKLDYLRRLRKALEDVSKPDATQADMAAALALQIEYQEFLSKLE